MHLDVATGGELHVALAAGVPADRLVLHGNNKSLEELRTRPRRRASAASSSTASTSSTASPRCTARTASCPTVLIRVTPGVEAHTHEFVRTGPGRLEVRLRRGRRATPPGRSTGPQDSPAVELVGLHMHIGSQVFVADFFHEAVEVVAPVRARAGPARAVDRRRARRRLRRGRGGAVDHRVGHGDRVGVPRRRHRRTGVGRAGPADRRPGAPSRSTRSARSRTCPASAPTSSVDGGMSDNPRPVLYGCGYEAFLPARPRRPSGPGGSRSSASTASRATCWCATPRCRPTSPSATSWPRRSPVPTGTRWAPTTTRCPRPPVVFVADGAARVVVRRETARRPAPQRPSRRDRLETGTREAATPTMAP